MKKTLTILLTFGLCVIASAQVPKDLTNDAILKQAREDGERVVTNGFWDNWSISAALGTQFYYGDNEKYMKFIDQWTFPAIDLFFNKMVTPTFGFGLGISGITIKGVARDDNEIASFRTDDIYTQRNGTTYYRQKGHYVDPFLYFFLDLDNLFGGYKPDRFYNITVYAGGGVMMGFDKDYGHWSPSYNTGILNSFRLNDKLSLTLNLRGALIGDNFDGECREGEPNVLSYKLKNIPLDGQAGITFGLTYRFTEKMQIFTKALDYKNEYYESYISNQGDEIVQLARTAAETAAREAALNNELAQNKTLLAEALANNYDPNFRFHINFDRDKTFLTNREILDLQNISEVMKMLPDRKFYIVGYADKQTGSAKHNVELSEGRVNIVFKTLTETFGINPDQLIKSHQGGVDTMFLEDSTLSRCVEILTVKK